MISPALRDALQPAERTCRILWLVLTLSMGLYVGVAFVVAQAGGQGAGIPFFAPALGAVAAATACVSIFAPRFLLSDERLRAAMAGEAARPALSLPFAPPAPERARLAEALGPEERRLLAVAELHFTPFVLQLALNEAIVIYGLVLALLERDFEAILPFAAAGVVLNVLARPRLGALVERAARLSPR